MDGKQAGGGGGEEVVRPRTFGVHGVPHHTHLSSQDPHSGTAADTYLLRVRHQHHKALVTRQHRHPKEEALVVLETGRYYTGPSNSKRGRDG